MTNIHSRTPDIVAVDGRGLPVRRVAYLRSQASAPTTALTTHQRFNVAGHLIEQWDPRLFDLAPNPNQASVHNLLGEPLHTDSVDAGWRLALPGLAGETLQTWDARGSHWRMDYDDQLRPVALEENGQANVDTFSYADATADAVHNLRGQLLEQTDPSGTVSLDSYGLLGPPLRQARVFPDFSVYFTEQTFDALGALVSQTDAGGHRQDMLLDVAGQLRQVNLQLRLAPAPQPILLAARYNAAGQIERQDAANGVISRWTYDPADGRLRSLQSAKPSENPRQDLAYSYDPVGNVLRIEDHTITTVHFANQRVDGHRDFTYDSLYRLTGASGFEGDTPHLQPGLPAPIIPIDPNRRFNYAQQYEYDIGGNLTRLRHVRSGNNHTQDMRIDSNSNRGVRWTDGDPEPDFDTLFDAHGNQQLLQTGTPALAWNSRDQLSNVTLIKRDNGLHNDDETYLYSQGERVEKKHTTASTVQQTRYLPDLEIRTSNSGEILHVITLGLAYGSVRCLHWEAGQPGGIEADQLRYSLDDHLGSSTLELDRAGGLITLEHYYPFGGTAWYAGRSAVEASYKTIRYSGKEMDASGLYYYGARYYAPWLQRWVSADPAGDVDGLNLYTFVGNNPPTYVDQLGNLKIPFALLERIKRASNKGDEKSKFDLLAYRHLELLSDVSQAVRDVHQQIDNHRSAVELGKSTALRTTHFFVEKGMTYAAGPAVGAVVGSIFGPVGTVLGTAIGFGVSKTVGKTIGYVGKKTGTTNALSLKPDRLDPDKVQKEILSSTSHRYIPDLLSKLNPKTREGQKALKKEAVTFALKQVEYAGPGLSTYYPVKDLLKDINAAGPDIAEEKIAELDTNIDRMIVAVQQGTEDLMAMAARHNIAEALGYSMDRIQEKTLKRVRMLNDLRVPLHSKSRKVTAV